MGRRQRKKISKLRLLLYLAVICCLAAVGRQGYQLYQIKKEQAATRERVEELKSKQQALEKEKADLHDPRYIEKVAREEYNMVGKDEVPIFVVEKEKAKP